MNLRCYLLHEGTPLKQVPMEADGGLPRHEGKPLWLDIEGGSYEQLYRLLSGYGLHHLHVDAFTDYGQMSRVSPVEGALFLEFNVLVGWERSDLRRISILHRKDLLLTVHLEPIAGLDELVKKLSESSAIWTQDTSFLLYHLLDYFIDESFQYMMTARQTIVELNDSYDESPHVLADQDIHGTRRVISRLATSCEDQYYVISAVQALEPDSLDLSLPKEYLHDLLSHAQYANRYVARLDDRAKELKFLVSASYQQRSEGRLRTITIIMAIFTPLTFLAGIYGMNFMNMPELTWRYGYFIVLGAMGTLAVILLIYFRRRGWFD